MIPFLDLTRRLTRFEPEYLDAVSRVMRSGTLLLGEETKAFEAETSASDFVQGLSDSVELSASDVETALREVWARTQAG